MQADLGIALQLLVMGMGITFGAILLLWGIMALLTRLTADRPVVETPSASSDREDSREEMRQRAAVAAVTVALARQTARPATRPVAMAVSPWQAAGRALHARRQGREQP